MILPYEPDRSRGENAMDAGNQQGRPNEQIGHYIAGFVDGEGSFHVAVQRNPTTRLKWQVAPEFHVSQNGGNRHVLMLIREILGCGYVNRTTQAVSGTRLTCWW